MSKIVEKYGSVQAAVDRLNELGKQSALAQEVGCSEYSVVFFLKMNGIQKVSRFVLPGDVRPWIELTREALNELHGKGA